MNDFNIIHNFITRLREAELVTQIQDAMKGIRTSLQEGRSRVLRFGWDYDSPKNLGPPPTWLPWQSGFDSWTINEYPTWQVIAPHFDSEKFGDEIRILSLGVDSRIKFVSPTGVFIVENVPSRSLIRFSGELRHKWKHATLPSPEGIRYSVVYRKLIK